MATINLAKKREQARPKFKLHFDYWLLLAVSALVVFGILTVYSTTFDIGNLWREDTNYYIKRQLAALLIGLVLMAVVTMINYRIFRRFSVIIMLATLGGLIVTLMFGEASLGATRGLLGGSYQPSEVAKLATIIYLAHWLSTKGERLRMLLYGLVPFSVITGVVCALIAQQPDLSTAVLIALVSFALFFIAGAHLLQFALAVILGGGAFIMVIRLLPHAMARIDAYVLQLLHPEEAGYQVKLILDALGLGGLFGVGPGASTQKFIPLPAAHTDGAFAIIAEEMGFIGGMVIIGLFALLVWRGILAGVRARDNFGALLAVGIAIWFGLQAFLNIAVITSLIPVTGMALPFISYGGSSLVVSLIGAGILLSISRDEALAAQPRTPPRRQG